MIERHQTKGEEIANSITHGLFLIAAIIVMPILVAKSIRTENNLIIMATGIFVVAVILVYFISTLYHAMPRNKNKGRMRIVDHGAIYLLIAGTYTPFALNVIKGNLGWFLFGRYRFERWWMRCRYTVRAPVKMASAPPGIASVGGFANILKIRSAYSPASTSSR